MSKTTLHDDMSTHDNSCTNSDDMSTHDNSCTNSDDDTCDSVSVGSSSSVSFDTITSTDNTHLYLLFTIRHPFRNEDFDKLQKSFQTSPELLILLVKTSKLFRPLTSTAHITNIQHGCVEIPNPAPTLEQYFQQFKVYRKDLHTRSKLNAQQLDPPKDFFNNVNGNFQFSKNSRYHKHENRKNDTLAYWAHYTNDGLQKWDILHAKIKYCELYETIIMNNPNSMKVFLVLHNEIHQNNRKTFVVSFGAYDDYTTFTNQNDIEQFFLNDKYDFPDCYVLTEMLVNYPNRSNYVWNKVNQIL